MQSKPFCPKGPEIDRDRNVIDSDILLHSDHLYPLRSCHRGLEGKHYQLKTAAGLNIPHAWKRLRIVTSMLINIALSVWGLGVQCIFPIDLHC